MAKFKEGDRVRFIYRRPCSIPWGSEGTVGEINGTILVKWDNCIANWVGESCLELVDLKPKEEKMTESPTLREMIAKRIAELDLEKIKLKLDELSKTIDDRTDAAIAAMYGATLAPKDDVEIIIDPKPEQVPEECVWGVFWHEIDDIDADLAHATSRFDFPDIVSEDGWKHCAILTKGQLSPSELAARVRKMLVKKVVL